MKHIVEAHNRARHFSFFVKKPKVAVDAAQAVTGAASTATDAVADAGHKVVDVVKHVNPAAAGRQLSRIRRTVPVSVQRKVGDVVLTGTKHAPSALFVGGVALGVASTVSACRSTLKVEAIVYDFKADRENVKTIAHLATQEEWEGSPYPEKDARRDLTIIYIRTGVKLAKLYGPALALGVASIAALTKSHNMLNSRNAALTAAYAALDKGFREYRGRVVEQYGEEKDREFRYSAEQRTIVEDTPQGPKKVKVKSAVKGVPSIYARYFDENATQWQRDAEYNRAWLHHQQVYLNDKLHVRGHVFLNEVYDVLGIPRSKAGNVVGWKVGDGNENYIDFGVYNSDNIAARDFVNLSEGSILLDFNVDGPILDSLSDDA